MKQLTVVRHAKSSWDYPDLADHDRPLNKRGERDAPAMGDRLAARGYRPELVISSSANRALTTATAIADAIGYPPDQIVVEERIYGIDVSRLVALVPFEQNRCALPPLLRAANLVSHQMQADVLIRAPFGRRCCAACGVMYSTMVVQVGGAVVVGVGDHRPY